MTIEEQHRLIGRLISELRAAKTEHARIVDERARNFQEMTHVAGRIAEIEFTLREYGIDFK